MIGSGHCIHAQLSPAQITQVLAANPAMSGHVKTANLGMTCMLPSLASHLTRYGNDKSLQIVVNAAACERSCCYRLHPSRQQSQQQWQTRHSGSLRHPASKPKFCSSKRRNVQAAMQLDNRELLVGDCLSLVSFCLYKQVRFGASTFRQRTPHSIYHSCVCHAD